MSSKPSSNPIRRRKGNRNAAKAGDKVILYVAGKRHEAELLDESPNGIGVSLPERVELREKQPVVVLYRRRTLNARVANVVDSELGVRVGIKF